MFKLIIGRWPELSKSRSSLEHDKWGDMVLRVLRGLIGDPRGKFKSTKN